MMKYVTAIRATVSKYVKGHTPEQMGEDAGKCINKAVIEGVSVYKGFVKGLGIPKKDTTKEVVNQ